MRWFVGDVEPRRNEPLRVAHVMPRSVTWIRAIAIDWRSGGSPGSAGEVVPATTASRMLGVEPGCHHEAARLAVRAHASRLVPPVPQTVPSPQAASLRAALTALGSPSAWVLGHWVGNRSRPGGTMVAEVIAHEVWWVAADRLFEPLTAGGANVELPLFAVANDRSAFLYADIDVPIVVLGVAATAPPAGGSWIRRAGPDCSLEELIARTG